MIFRERTRLFITTIAVVCCVQLLEAQSPFMNGLQTPLLINSGYTGSKKAPRICLAFLASNQNLSKRNAQYLSYDQFAEKRKYGWGFYVVRESNEQELILSERDKYKEHFDSPLLENTSLKQNNITVGLSSSLKYNMRPHKKLDIISGTVSSGFGLEYSRKAEKLGGLALETTSDVLNSDSIRIVADSLFFTEADVIVNQLSFNKGVKLTTKGSLFGYQMSVFGEVITERFKLHSGSQIFNSFSTEQKTIKGALLGLSHKVTLAHVFFKSSSYRWKWNNYFGFVMLHYFPVFNPISDITFASEAVRFRYNLPFIQSVNGMSYLRRNKVMIGLIYHKYLSYQSAGVLAGLNLNRTRITAVYSPFKSNNYGRTLELSVNHKLK